MLGSPPSPPSKVHARKQEKVKNVQLGFKMDYFSKSKMNEKVTEMNATQMNSLAKHNLK